MPEVHQRPLEGQHAGLPIDLCDPAQRRRWLADMEAQIEDAVAASEDATRPLGRRVLGRVSARRQILEAERALRELMDAAQGTDPAEARQVTAP
jgi:hypothetical protein